MYKIYSLKLILVGLIWWPLTSCALSDSIDALPKLIDSKIDTKFSVVDNTLQVLRGDEQTVKNDNRHLISALKLKHIFINEYDYSVTVSRNVYSTKTESPLELFEYTIRFQSLNKSLIDEFSSLANSEFIKTNIPLIKQPTTCYVFSGKAKLHLLCRYGLVKNAEIPEIISRIKNQEM